MTAFPPCVASFSRIEDTAEVDADSLKELLGFSTGAGFAGVVALWMLYSHERVAREALKLLESQNRVLTELVAAINRGNDAADRGDRLPR